jgi:2-methylcitrate dehydratase
MIEYPVRVYRSAENIAKEDQLAWHIADFAAAARRIDPVAAAMTRCRIVDNAAAALAGLNRPPVRSAFSQALAHPRAGGAGLFGLPRDITVHAEWAAWANATAVRELDYHDTYLAADYAHPGDNISPLIAVAQQCGRSGDQLLEAILVAYEVHVALVKSISLHKHKIDHVAHLAPATTAGIGSLLGLSTDVIFQAVNQAVHLAFSTRQSRKGEISSWKACVPGHSGKLAVESIDRAMRGETAPSPIYEGEDSVIAWMLDGPDGNYTVALPEPGEPALGILETYTKAHSAEYQAQALIDLAIDLQGRIDIAQIDRIVLHTSHHTHNVIGTGASDPQKSDPKASRETLDHSITYILAVALEDGNWHHESSYPPHKRITPETVALWHAIETVEDPNWTELYHHPDPARRAFGGELEIVMKDGSTIREARAVADAHPNGRAPWEWEDYVGKFDQLALEKCGTTERNRFLDTVRNLESLTAIDIRALHPTALEHFLPGTPPDNRGIFDCPHRDP